MTSFKLLAITAVLCLQCILAKDLKVDKLKQEWLVKGNNLVVYDKMLAKTFRTFLYAVCDDSSSPNQLNCDFVLEKYMSIKNERKNFTCSRKIVAPKNRKIVKDLRVEKFEVDSMFFSWTEKEGRRSYLKYGFIYMPYCELVHTGEIINSDERAEKFIMYRNTFDVVDYNSKSCESEVCRLTHTQAGKPFGKPEFFPDFFRAKSIQPVQFDGPNEGFFALADYGNTLWAMHVSEHGDVTPLQTIPNEKFWHPRVAYERFGVCYSLEANKVQCSQIDFNLRWLMNTTVVLEETQKLVAVFNMNSDGMLLLTGQCEDESNVFSCSSLSAFKVHENGQKSEPYDVPIPDFDCQPRPGTTSVDIKQNGPTDCFFFAGICEQNGSSSIKFNRRCFE